MLVALGLDFVTGRPLRAKGQVRRIVGGCMAVSGIGLAGWAVAAAEEVDVDRPDRLITGGPYALSRNPMYLAWHLLYGGLLMFTGSRWLLRLFPAVLLTIHLDILGEEKRLSLAFGDEYASYRSQVRRYF